jgi:adenosylhomocysteine nucleosidase
LSVGLHVDRGAVESSPSLHVGRLLTVDHLVRSSAEKRRLGEQWGALACDMETMAVAEVCHRAQTRFLSVRIITDGLDDELPKEIEKFLDQSSSAARWGAAAGALLHRPSRIKDLWNLKEEALKASDRLAKFLVGVVSQLGNGPGPEAPRLA